MEPLLPFLLPSTVSGLRQAAHSLHVFVFVCQSSHLQADQQQEFVLHGKQHWVNPDHRRHLPVTHVTPLDACQFADEPPDQCCLVFVDNHLCSSYAKDSRCVNDRSLSSIPTDTQCCLSCYRRIVVRLLRLLLPFRVAFPACF